MSSLLRISISCCLLLSSIVSARSNEKVVQEIQSSHLTGHQSLSFKDKDRQREVKAFVWYPVQESVKWEPSPSLYPWGRIANNAEIKDKTKHKPLIVISHGFAGEPDEFYWLIETLVKANYMVLATKHHDLPPHINYWHRAADIKFMLTEFLKSPVGKSVDPSKVGFVGFSLGGMTGISLAGAVINTKGIVPQDTHVRLPLIREDAKKSLPGLDKARMEANYHDPRIKAEFLFAPAWAWLFSAEELKKIKIPMYIVSGDKDEVLVPETNGLWYAQNIHHAKFQWIKGCNHFAFLGAPTYKGRQTMEKNGSMDYLFEDPHGVQRSFVHEQMKRSIVQFFNSVLR